MGPVNIPHLTCLESILDSTDTFLSPFRQIIPPPPKKWKFFIQDDFLKLLKLQCCRRVCCAFASVDLFTVKKCPLRCQPSHHFQRKPHISMHVSTKSGKSTMETLQIWVNISSSNYELILCSYGERHQWNCFFFPCLATLRRIDLTGNVISEIDDGAFSKLHNLEELILEENRLTKLPMLPTKLVSFNANNNKLRTQGVKANAFKVSCLHFQTEDADIAYCISLLFFNPVWLVGRTHICNLLLQKLTRLAYLYLGNNELTAVPQLPESLHVVHLHVSWSMITIIRVGLSVTFCLICQKHYILALVSCVCSAE